MSDWSRGRFMQCAAVIRTKAESSNMIYCKVPYRQARPTALCLIYRWWKWENLLNMHYSIIWCKTVPGACGEKLRYVAIRSTSVDLCREDLDQCGECRVEMHSSVQQVMVQNQYTMVLANPTRPILCCAVGTASIVSEVDSFPP